MNWLKSAFHWFVNNISSIKDFVNILQAGVIIAVTIFTARWTYKTFAHKEKIEELKELKRTVELYHFKLTLFCAHIRPSDQPDDREIAEKMEIAQIHNKLVSLASLNLYTKAQFRQRVQQIVGTWIAEDRFRKMQRGRTYSPPEDVIVATWQQFDKEYETVRTLIDNEAVRFL
jgi:hypothetical protein